MRKTAWTLLLLLTLELSAQAKPAKLLDLADTVARTRILSKFDSMVKASALTTLLSSKGPFILFAPTNSAFARLAPGTLDDWLKPENQEKLQRILLFHLVNGKKMSAKDLLTVPSLISCEGTPLHLRKTGTGAQYVMKAKIVHADIRCLNGIIHQIDAVLIPADAATAPVSPAIPESTGPVSATAPASITNAPALLAPATNQVSFPAPTSAVP